MDSITQAALGAAIGEVSLGRKIGNKAIAWGAAVGSLADLDILFYPLMDEVTKLTWHRGYSHSLLLNLLLAPLVGWLLSKLHKGQAELREWIRMALWVMVAAILLDAFTVYGTQLLQPFSDFPVGFNSIFIVDPLFTLPLLIGVIAALFFRRTSGWRFKINLLGLVLACAYLTATVAFKAHVNLVAEREFIRQDMKVARYMSGATPFNTILWRVLAQGDGGHWVGYYSLFDREEKIQFHRFEKDDHLLDEMRNERAVETINWFSRGYYEVRRETDRLLMSDLRFGELDISNPNDRQYIFTWELVPTGQPSPEALTIRQYSRPVGDRGETMRDAIRKLFIRMGGI